MIMRRPTPIIYFIIAISLSMLSCTSMPEHATESTDLPSIYPDYVDVTIPTGIAPLNFAMSDDTFTTIDVEIKGAKGGHLHAQGTYTDFDIDDWHQMVDLNRGSQLTVSVCAEKDGGWVRYRDFTITVSPYPLDEWGITYRKIAPSYEMYSRMGLFERELSTFEEHSMLQNTQVPGMCLNCHTANRTNPQQYVFHVRGSHGATIIHREGETMLLKASNDSLGGSMVYPYWHPGGRYCAFSTNKTSQMFHTARAKRIEVYDASSDVFVYDAEAQEIVHDTLTMRKYWAENAPAFSPDGQWLYYITARRQIYPTDYDKEKYSLCRVHFDEHTGRMDGQVDTLISTTATGKSVSWPRPSYDGRYLMYTQADYGYFTVWHPEADLWLLDLQTGECRAMQEVNSSRAESLHNWSVNSHWFLFTSRRDDGLYSRIYLSCIGADGRATKPFMLPQRNPKQYYRQSLYSYNTPDFTSSPVKMDAYELGNQIEKGERVETKMR